MPRDLQRALDAAAMCLARLRNHPAAQTGAFMSYCPAEREASGERLEDLVRLAAEAADVIFEAAACELLLGSDYVRPISQSPVIEDLLFDIRKNTRREDAA